MALNSMELNDLKIFSIYPYFRVVIGMNFSGNVSTNFHLGIDDILNANYTIGYKNYSEIIYVQYMSISKYYIYVKDSVNNVDLVIRDTSGNVQNPFSSRVIKYKDHFVRDNVFYLVGIENNTTVILFVFMKGELLFESVVGNQESTFGLGDLYYKDKSTNASVLKLIEMYHNFIGIYRYDVNLIQISGTVPDFFDNTYIQKNVYYDNITNQITDDRSKNWIGLKNSNLGFYIKY
jgi:hypothetical protein